jgi:hypothetical protein
MTADVDAGVRDTLPLDTGLITSAGHPTTEVWDTSAINTRLVERAAHVSAGGDTVTVTTEGAIFAAELRAGVGYAGHAIAGLALWATGINTEVRDTASLPTGFPFSAAHPLTEVYTAIARERRLTAETIVALVVCARGETEARLRVTERRGI